MVRYAELDFILNHSQVVSLIRYPRGILWRSQILLIGPDDSRRPFVKICWYLIAYTVLSAIKIQTFQLRATIGIILGKCVGTRVFMFYPCHLVQAPTKLIWVESMSSFT